MKRAIVTRFWWRRRDRWVGAASAATRHETTIKHNSSVELASNWVLDSGRIYSSKQDCERNRRVTALARFADGRSARQDSGTSTFNGAWATRTDKPGRDDAKFSDRQGEGEGQEGGACEQASPPVDLQGGVRRLATGLTRDAIN